MEYMKPVDGNMWASVYMYKPRNEKLLFGPLWDFDLAAGSANRAGNVVSSSSFYLRNNLGVSAQQSSNTWFNCLNKRSSFRAAVKARWNEVKNDLDTTTFIDDQAAIIADSANKSFSCSQWGEPQLPHQQVPGHQELLERRRQLPEELGQRPEELAQQQLLIGCRSSLARPRNLGSGALSRAGAHQMDPEGQARLAGHSCGGDLCRPARNGWRPHLTPGGHP